MWSLSVPRDFRQPREHSESVDLGDFPSSLKLDDADSGSSSPSFSAREFVNILNQLDVPGPLTLTSPVSNRTEIARGSQFTVHRGDAALVADHVRGNSISVAVKRCHVPTEMQDSFDITSVKVQRQVHDMYLEVRALGNTALRQHRNTVELLGWASDRSNTAMPLLIMELAMGNLVDLLSDLNSDSNEWSVKHHVCLDISAGLDAIHQAGIVHADFKPSNILIFQTSNAQVKYIAKLADFGFSVTELDDTNAGVVHVAGLTKGWEAPEIRRCRTAWQPITAHDYFKADNYSLGLVVWSLICFRGYAPPFDDPPIDDRIAHSIEAIRSIPMDFSRLTIHAIQSILITELYDRPITTAGLFRDGSHACQAWMKDAHAFAENQVHQTRVHKWPLDDISQYRLFKMPSSAVTILGSDNISNAELLSLFLHGTCSSMHRSTSISSTHIRALLTAAERNFTPAQGIAHRVLESYAIEWPHVHEDKKLRWLFNGAAAGCLVAKADLNKIDAALTYKAETIFRHTHQYLQHYLPPDSKDVSLWNDLFIHGSLKEAKEEDASSMTDSNESLKPSLSETFQQQIEDHTDLQKQTILHMACVAGNLDLVRYLCHTGVSATLRGPPNGATCLHWLFNFPSECLKEVADLLMKNGADVNAQLGTKSTGVRWYFPFEWPAGSPLHWAVAASNAAAVEVLIDFHADCSIRDGVDPYMYDSNARYLDHEEPGGAYTLPSTKSEGLSAWDIAVSNHDWRMIEALGTATSASDEVARGDEEGHTPFHRLVYNWISRPTSGGKFWYGAFLGSKEARFGNIVRTVKALLAIGGDIDRESKPSPEPLREGEYTGSLTPLMLAVMKADLTTVRVLLSCGANPNVLNSLGYNALCVLPVRGDPEVCFSDIPLVVIELLRHGAKPDVCSPFWDRRPLARAIESGSLEAVEPLLEAGADWRMKQKKLSILAFWMQYWRLDRYLQYPDTTPESWETCEGQIVRLLNVHVLEKHDTDLLDVLNNVDEVGGTLLHYAAHAGLAKVVELLIEASVDKGKVRGKPPPMGDTDTNMYARLMGPGTALHVVSSRYSELYNRVRRYEQGWERSDYLFMLDMFEKAQGLLST